MIEIYTFEETVEMTRKLVPNLTGAKISGGRLICLSSGWAIGMFNFGKAHYVKLSASGQYIPVCMPHATEWATEIFGPGNHDVCKRCLRYTKLHNIAPPPIKTIPEKV